MSHCTVWACPEAPSSFGASTPKKTPPKHLRDQTQRSWGRPFHGSPLLATWGWRGREAKDKRRTGVVTTAWRLQKHTRHTIQTWKDSGNTTTLLCIRHKKTRRRQWHEEIFFMTTYWILDFFLKFIDFLSVSHAIVSFAVFSKTANRMRFSVLGFSKTANRTRSSVLENNLFF